jgi:RNA polymerase sigma-70 factor (ECF subfamily)
MAWINTVTTAEQNAQFSAWLAEHAAMLHHVANGFATGADRNDLMQELLLSLWHAVPAFRGGSQPSTFIYRVAHNTALTWKRTQRNYARRVEQFEATLPVPAAPAFDAGERERELLEILYTHIRALPPLDRSLILLQLEGVSYAGIAAIHGLSESNVGVRLNRLRLKLTTAMQEVTHELR